MTQHLTEELPPISNVSLNSMLGCVTPKRVIVACEESQAVTKAFRELGHEAYSCDIQDCSGGHPEWHIKGDAIETVYRGGEWDILIGHPPCTYISFAATHVWNKPGRVFKRLEALEFFAKLWEAPVPMICLENPKSCASPVIAKYSQIIQPYYFGDEQFKTTWLWLKGLPPLKYALKDNLFETQSATEMPQPISIDNTPRAKKRHFTEGSTRDPKLRSKTFPGIARAMAEQWGGRVTQPNRELTAQRSSD